MKVFYKKYFHLNVFTFISYRGIRRARNQVHASNHNGEINLAVTLISICSVFMFCHALRFYLAIKAVLLLDTTVYCMKELGVCAISMEYVPYMWEAKT